MPYHRYVVEEHTGQKIKRGYIVHHKNGVKTDNRLENLQVMTVNAHKRHHKEWRRQKRIRKRIMRQNRILARARSRR